MIVFNSSEIDFHRRNYLGKNANYIFIGEKFFPINGFQETSVIKINADVKSAYKRKQSIEVVIKKLDTYTIELTDQLNKMHETNYPSIYWRKLLASFWIHFLTVVDDRFNRVKKLNEKVGKVSAPQSLPYPTLPEDSWKFLSEVKDGEREYQIIDLLTDHSSIRIEADFKYGENKDKVLNKSCFNYLRKFLDVIVYFRRPVLIVDGYFDHFESIKIMLFSKLKVVFIPSKFFTKNCFSYLTHKQIDRSKLKVKVNDDFDEAVNCLLPSFFPKSFLEDFYSRKEFANFYAKNLSGVGTAVCIHTDDTYKIILAELFMNGKRSIAFQHGGAYGLQKSKLSEHVEQTTSEYYLKWSNETGIGLNKLRKLDKYKKKRNLASKNKFLWVSTSTAKHTYRYNIADTAADMLEMYSQQRNFYSSLNQKIQDQVVLRPYPKDFGWSYRELWEERFSLQINFSENESFYEDLVSTKLYFADHISTTWVESLYLGVPILLVFPLDKYDFKDDFMEILRALEKQSVYHHSYESACLFLNSCYDYIEIWWNSEECKMAINELKSYLYSDKKVSSCFISRSILNLVSK